MTERSRWDGSDLVFGEVDRGDVIWDHAGDVRQVGDVPVKAPHDVCQGEVSSAAFEAVTAAGRDVNQEKEEDRLHLYFMTLPVAWAAKGSDKRRSKNTKKGVRTS